MFLAFRTRVLRSLPYSMGSAFLIAVVGLLVSSLLKSQSLNLGRILVSSLAFALVWGAVVAPMTAHSLRKEERIPARSLIVRRMFFFSLTWSVAFGAVGLTLLGCAMGFGECLSASSLSTALVASVAIGGVLSLMVFSS
jgi:hypothetical protein